MESHASSGGQQVLTSTAKALECREREFTMYGVFCFATFTNSYAYKFIIPEAHFHADMIGASPAVIARKMVKLFKFLYSPTQRGPTTVKRFWQHWSNEYCTILWTFVKWNRPHHNLWVGDLVCLHDEGMFPTKWSGKDSLVPVITVKTSYGTYKRPMTKAALLLPADSLVHWLAFIPYLFH